MTKHHPQHHHLHFLLPLLFDSTTPLSYLDHNLRPKPDLQHELAHLASNEFSPPLSFSTFEPVRQVHPPDDVRHLLRSLVECTSPLIEWSTDLIHQMGYSTYKELFDNQILQMPYIYKHYIDKNDAGESFGTDGKYTKELLERHRRTMAFWTEADVDDSISTDDILLLSMHGEDLLDMDKLVPTVQRMFDFEDVNDVVAFASTIRDFVATLPEGGGNPLLTMNAIATRAARRRDLPIDGLRDSIIVGDGVLRFLEETGLASSGPDFVHAHEFGHHIQFEMDMAISSRYLGMEGYHDDARRKEMMADAIAAYFLAHDRGGNMGEEEIEEFVATSYATGDCSVMDEDHHGTPEQRKCAAAWGASQAAPDGGGLVDPEAFVREFDEVYGRILALDGVECTLVLEEPEEEEVVAGGGWEEATGDEADGDYGTEHGVDIPYFQSPEITLNIDIPDNTNSGVQVINQPEIDLGMNLPNEESQWDEQEEEEPEAADPAPYIPPQIDQEPHVESQEEGETPAYVPPVVDIPQVQVVPPTQGQSAYQPQDEEIIQQAPPPATTAAAFTTQATEAAAAAATSTSIATNHQESHYYGDSHSGPTNQPPTEPQQQDSESAGALSDSYLRNRGSPSLSQSDLDYASPLQETISDNRPVFGDDQDPIIVKTIGPPDQTRSFNMIPGVKEFSSEDCGLPWVYCSPEMEEMAAANGGDGSRRGGKSLVVFGCVVGLMML